MPTCPFCNEHDAPRHTGSMICINCEAIRDMVRGVPVEEREGLRYAWHDVIELHNMYRFVKERIESEEDSILWMTYWNMERTAICVELFKRFENKVGYQCFMMTREEAYEFVENPPWKENSALGLEDDEKQGLLENLRQLLDQ